MGFVLLLDHADGSFSSLPGCTERRGAGGGGGYLLFRRITNRPAYISLARITSPALILGIGLTGILMRIFKTDIVAVKELAIGS